MSKAEANTTTVKPDSNPYKKENRSNQGNKDDKKELGNHHRGGENHQNQRDRSSNRNDRRDNTQNQQPVESMDDKDIKTEQTQSISEKKFTGRCRLFVGNLTLDVTENEFIKMFEPYGETSESYVNQGRGFGFIRLDYRHNAEAAKAGLDGLQRKGRFLRVRFATHGAALKVKHLHPFVSNELLEQSFTQFGDLERCIVIVDDRGKATGEGIVEFVRKPGANSALRRITEGVFLVGADPKPVAVEPLEQRDEEDGMPEKFLIKTDQYKKEREKEPRFAPPGTFEYEFGMRWKQIEDLEKQRFEQVKKDTEESRLKLEDEMQNALYEYQAEQIRQDLARQQEELRRLEELRNADRMRRQQEMEIRRQKDDRERAQVEERRRADMMMNMRQHDMARGGRGAPMDSVSHRQREEMMMAERYGDRISDRMGERMPERMGERMPERMGERMGGQGAAFMWPDEKARAENAMRSSDPGRGGRDMRGASAHPLQPQPPSGIGAIDRGGGAQPPPSGAQGVKTNPKPLMQAGAGFNQPGGNAGPNTTGGAGSNVGPNPAEGAGGPGQSDMNQMRRSRVDQGAGPDNGFQNQRGVLGSGPGAIGSSPSGMGSSMNPAAMAANQMRGGGPMGGPGGSPNMFQGGQDINERMIMERRRQAAREELTDIKRMRRM